MHLERESETNVYLLAAIVLLLVSFSFCCIVLFKRAADTKPNQSNLRPSFTHGTPSLEHQLASMLAVRISLSARSHVDAYLASYYICGATAVL